MSKHLDELGVSTNLRIDQSKIKARVNETLNASPLERKIFMRHKAMRVIAIAAAITTILTSTAFAVSPAGQEAIGTILSYFANDKSTEITDITELAKYNEEIGASAEGKGYKVTLDNVAADDNFIHVFYTVKSEDKPFYTGDESNVFVTDSDTAEPMNIVCLINGEDYIFYENEGDNYFEDAYTYKAVCKYNIADKTVADKFTVELVCEIGSEAVKDDSVSNRLMAGEQLTEEDKNSVLYIRAEADKSKVKTKSVSYALNARLPWLDSTATELLLSPFGKQLVIETDAGQDPRVDRMAIRDENGQFIDILNTGFSWNPNEVSKNTFQLLKVTADTRELEFIPIEYDEIQEGNLPELKSNASGYPITFNISGDGNVVVTNVRIKDGEIDVDYYKDGFVMYDPSFIFYDKNGNTFEPGGKLGCLYSVDVHYATNSYTARYVYDKYDDNGNYVQPDESVSAQALTDKLSQIGTFDESYIKLDFDNSVKVKLK